jgi:hypothetical protein
MVEVGQRSAMARPHLSHEENMMITGPEVAQHAKEQLVQLTGLQPDTIAALKKNEEGWQVTVILLEMKCIPDGDDVLAIYETFMDGEGNLISYHRTSRYCRSHVGELEG